MAGRSSIDFKRVSITGETLNSANCVVLVKAQSRGIELLRHYVTVDYLNARYVLGEKVERCTKAIHTRM